MDDLPLATPLGELLEHELAAQGEPSPAARAAAHAEFARALGGFTASGASSALACLPSRELEQALARALRAAAGQAPSEAPSVAAPAGESAAWSQVRALLAGASEDFRGRVLDGKYELEALVAEGGFGQVYRARDRDLDCAVAIKILKPAASGSRALEAFKEEARRLTRLRHPNIVEWKTLNQTADGRVYLVMEYLEGEVLEDVLAREGRLEPRRAARILLGVLDALSHAHALGDGSSLLHLDLKPSNVFLVHERAGEERVKVLDFGISRFVGQEPRAAAGGADVALALGETTRVPDGTAAGLACTPHYCSPEQARRIVGERPAPPQELPPLDGRADLYSLGVMGYRMLTGRLPFEGASGFLELLRRHREEPAPPVGAQGVALPKALARAIDRCLLKDPARRFADAREAHAAFQRIVQPRALGGLVALAAAVLLALGTLAYARFAAREPLPSLALASAADGRALAGTTLFFGPAQRARTLVLLDAPPEAELGRVRLVDEPRAGAAELAGWSLRALGERRVELEARAPGARRARAFLALEGAETVRFSEAFELCYLEPADARITGLDVPGRAGRALAPQGQRLELRVAGAPDVLAASADVAVGARHYSASRDASRSSVEGLLYVLDLSRVEFAPGPCELEVRVDDLAGNAHVERLALELVLEPLRIERAALGSGTFGGGRWSLLAGEASELQVRCNRPARVRWSLEDAGGAERAHGEGPGEPGLALDPALFGGSSFGGALRVSVDEEQWVAHAADSPQGRDEARLELEVRPVGAVFEVSLTGARERLEPSWNEPVRYVAAEALELALLRDHDVPMQVSVRCLDGDGLALGAPAEVVFRAPQELRKTLPLALPADGRYRLACESARLGPDGTPFTNRDERRELLVLRDTRAPVVTVDGWHEGFVQRAEAEAPRLAVRVDEPTFTPEPPPVVVRWTLEVRGADEPVRSVAGEFEAAAGALTPFTPPVLGDGEYELALRAQDFAGNPPAQGARYRWSVAAVGPRLRVLVPAQGESWARMEQEFAVELRVEDSNGVATVRCELRDALGKLAPLALELAAAPEAVAGVGRWTGRFALDPRWSRRAVELRFTGVDGQGTATLEPLVVGCTVAALPNLVPPHLDVSFHGRGRAPMARVPGNAGSAYWFGGRGDALENSAFRAAGLADFARGALASSMRIEVPRGALADYYLDVHEVTVAQYLEFLAAAEAGVGEVVDVARRAELAGRLAALAPELPVTGVTQAEAQAYARWAGKALPTYLHWEYAVRGADARPFSFLGVAPLLELGKGVNVGTGAPWPVTQGLDRTADTGLYDLCSNVAEWTCTPDAGRLSALESGALLAPEADPASERAYAVGGSFARPAFHFGVVTRARGASDSIGFRCMLPAASVESAFLGDESSYTVVPLR